MSEIKLKSTGIYKIQNITNFKCYMGSAQISFTNRFGRHRHDLRKGIHHCKYLQNAWNKYGEESFIFVPLLEKPPEECIDWEQHFFDFYQPEYNILKTAKHPGARGKHRDLESRNKNARTFLLISPKGQIVEGLNLREFCRNNDLFPAGVRDLLKGEKKVRSYKGWTRNLEDYLILKTFGSFSNYEIYKNPYILEHVDGTRIEIVNQTVDSEKVGLCLSSLNGLINGKYKERKGWKYAGRKYNS